MNRTVIMQTRHIDISDSEQKPVKVTSYYEYKGMRITRSGDKRFPWMVSTVAITGSMNDRYTFHTVSDAASFIDRFTA